MTTVVNNSDGQASSGGGMGFVVGMILVLLTVFVVFVYGLPALRQSTQSQAPQVNVPDQVDINVNKTE